MTEVKKTFFQAREDGSLRLILASEARLDVGERDQVPFSTTYGTRQRYTTQNPDNGERSEKLEATIVAIDADQATPPLYINKESLFSYPMYGAGRLFILRQGSSLVEEIEIDTLKKPGQPSCIVCEVGSFIAWLGGDIGLRLVEMGPPSEDNNVMHLDLSNPKVPQKFREVYLRRIVKLEN